MAHHELIGPDFVVRRAPKRSALPLAQAGAINRRKSRSYGECRLKSIAMARFVWLATLAIAFLIAFPSGARAVAVQGVAQDVPYILGFAPLNSQQQPYLGQMHLNFNNGIISGRYTDISIRPGSPLANAHSIAVSGGLSGDHVSLHIRQITFRGTMKGTWMSGSTTIRGGIYNFEAEQGTPGSGR
jgi:hypothetical protein